MNITEVMGAIGTLLLGSSQAYIAWTTRNTRLQMNEVRVATDGMKDALVKSTAVASHAKGLAEGLAIGKITVDATAVKQDEG